MTDTPLSAVRLAPAKVNLWLELTGKRPSGPQAGYHELDSLMVFADIGDRVTVTAADDLSFDLSGPMARYIDVDGQDNLVMRAAHALQQATDSRGGARIHLEKNLPVAAGIGGGSADAAAALWALNDLWQTGLTEQQLADIALPLGADIPPCLASRPVVVRGIGEDVRDIDDLPDCWIVLVNIMQPVATPPVFKAFADSGAAWSAAKSADLSGLPFPDFVAALHMRHNDLQAPAISICPDIALCLEMLQNSGAPLVRMSGSGATCFALCPDEASARAASDSIKAAQPGWWVQAGRML